MNAQRFTYSIWLVRPQRRETPAVIGQKFLATLDALSAADPLFTPWRVLDIPAMAALPRNVAVVVSEAVKANKFGGGGAPAPEPAPEPAP